MSEVTINNSPVHSQSTLTAVYGEMGEHWARFHTGIDFVPYGSTENNPLLYSVCNGEIVYINTTTTPALGIQAVIKEDNSNRYWRYCHMIQGSLRVNVGDRVTTESVIGQMGATGNVTGRHLHLECSTSQTWSYDYFLNPANELGIPNERGTIINYDGEVPPTPPIPPVPQQTLKKKKFKWALYSKKLRERRN